MKRLFILIFIILLIVPVLIARDGHYWKKLKYDKDESELSLMAKKFLLDGMYTGLGWLSHETGVLAETLYKTASAGEGNFEVFVDMLDDFYSDYANLDIEIIDALAFCLLRLKGIHDDDTAKEELRVLRKIFSDRKTILSLLDEIVHDGKLYECIRVIDGDTIVVKRMEHEPYRLIGEEIRVRLIGIDCPELEESFGSIARKRAKVRVEGKPVSLSYGKTRKDRYGRTLAYVNVIEDEKWLNEMMIESGHARVLSKYIFGSMVRYKRLEAMAKLSKHGVWAEK